MNINTKIEEKREIGAGIYNVMSVGNNETDFKMNIELESNKIHRKPGDPDYHCPECADKDFGYPCLVNGKDPNDSRLWSPEEFNNLENNRNYFIEEGEVQAKVSVNVDDNVNAQADVQVEPEGQIEPETPVQLNAQPQPDLAKPAEEPEEEKNKVSQYSEDGEIIELGDEFGGDDEV